MPSFESLIIPYSLCLETQWAFPLFRKQPFVSFTSCLWVLCTDSCCLLSSLLRQVFQAFAGLKAAPSQLFEHPQVVCKQIFCGSAQNHCWSDSTCVTWQRNVQLLIGQFWGKLIINPWERQMACLQVLLRVPINQTSPPPLKWQLS